jgi:hypothetical protein
VMLVHPSHAINQQSHTSSRLLCFLRVSDIVPLPKDMEDIEPDVEVLNLDEFGGSGEVARSGKGTGECARVL